MIPIRSFGSDYGTIEQKGAEKMGFFKQWGQFMIYGTRRFAQWEIRNSNIILQDR